MTESTKFHPAITVTNIKNLIPITLEMEKSQYSSWAELFKIHCRAYQVIDHIITPPAPVASSSKDKETTDPISPETWARLDAIVLQWIYSTISNDLLHTILAPDSTAKQAWDHLKGIFQDNKNSRALYLERQFTNTQLDNFANVSAYCQELKVIVDQLSNVGAPVSNDRLVLQLIAGLNESYDGVATIIQQNDPLPAFYEARSKIILEETRKMKQATAAATSSGTALVTSTAVPNASKPSNNGGTNTRGSGSNTRGRGGGRGNTNRGRGNNGRGRGRGNGGNHTGQHQQPLGPFGSWVWQPQPWASAPCPYPTTGWTRPTNTTGQPSILGPRPQQPYAASVAAASTIPTDIETAMHTMTLNPPDDNWYMDTGASSHMTTSPGKLLSYFNSS